MRNQERAGSRRTSGSRMLILEQPGADSDADAEGWDFRGRVAQAGEGKHPLMGSQGTGPTRAGEDRSSVVATPVGVQTQPE